MCSATPETETLSNLPSAHPSTSPTRSLYCREARTPLTCTSMPSHSPSGSGGGVGFFASLDDDKAAPTAGSSRDARTGAAALPLPLLAVAAGSGLAAPDEVAAAAAAEAAAEAPDEAAAAAAEGAAAAAAAWAAAAAAAAATAGAAAVATASVGAGPVSFSGTAIWNWSPGVPPSGTVTINCLPEGVLSIICSPTPNPSGTVKTIKHVPSGGCAEALVAGFSSTGS